MRKRVKIAVACCIASVMPVLYGADAHAFDEASRALLGKGVEEWNRMKKTEPARRFDLSGVRLRGANLRGIDLRDTDLRGCDMEGSDLSDADLRGALLDSARFVKALLFDADMRGASLPGADMEESGLAGADLRGAVLDGAILREADLNGALLRDASFRGVDFRAADLRSADLAGSDLAGAYLWRADLDGANLSGVAVSAVTVLRSGKKASRAWAEKHEAVFVETAPGNEAAGRVAAAEESAPGKLKMDREAWPVNPVQQKIRFGVTREQAAELSYDVHQRELLVKDPKGWNEMRAKSPGTAVRLSGSKLNRKILDGADLRDADLSEALLKGADLSDADLRRADLRGANLREADLTGADLRGADLCGAYLWRANLSWTKIGGVKVDSRTVLQTGKNATPEWAEKHEAVYRAAVPAKRK